MTWTWREDEEFGELMEDFEHFVPAIERISHQDERMAEFERRLSELEGNPRPSTQYGLGINNPLLRAIKDLKGD